MDTTARWPQANSDPRHLEMGLVGKPTLEEMVSSTTNTTTRAPQLGERRPRPQREQSLGCPRCHSTNTKFCYYNNYSLTQPRYFCKTCRRYWTEGGTLRNVPVGGGSRKNKRAPTSSTVTTRTPTTPSHAPTSSLSSSANSSRKLPADLTTTTTPPPPTSSFLENPNNKFHEGQELTLASFPQQQVNGGGLGEFHALDSSGNCSTLVANPPTCSSAGNGGSLSAMELLRSGLSMPGPSPFVPMMQAGAVNYPGVLQDFGRSTSLGFSLNGMGGGGGYGGVQEGGGRLFFPLEDLRQQVSSAPGDQFDQNRGQGGDPTGGFWNGLVGGGAGSW